MRVGSANKPILTTVTIVTNDLLASGDFSLEALVAEDLDVMPPSLKRTLHPTKSIFKNRDSKLVVDSSFCLNLWE
jgi:hypothetical protein